MVGDGVLEGVPVGEGELEMVPVGDGLTSGVVVGVATAVGVGEASGLFVFEGSFEGRSLGPFEGFEPFDGPGLWVGLAGDVGVGCDADGLGVAGVGDGEAGDRGAAD